MTPIQHDPISELMPKLRKRARRLCQSHDEAEDMAQETALRILQVLDQRDGIEEPENYAMTTLHNLARQRWRQRKPTQELTEDVMLEAPLAPVRLACAELCNAIERLPEDQSVLMMRVMAGETSPAALAREFGLPKGTVMSRLARARARLRQEMGLSQSASVEELF